MKKKDDVEYCEIFKNYCKEKAEEEKKSERCKSCEYYYYNYGTELCKIREDAHDIHLTYEHLEYPASCELYKKKPYYRRVDLFDICLDMMMIFGIVTLIIVMILVSTSLLGEIPIILLIMVLVSLWIMRGR